MTLVLAHWDLRIVFLEALSRPPCELLLKASLSLLEFDLENSLSLSCRFWKKTQWTTVLVFVLQYCQSKPRGAGVTLPFSPEFMQENQRPHQANDPWYILTVWTGKPDFGAPNCPVGALRYDHRFMAEHSELRRADAACLLNSRTTALDPHRYNGFSCRPSEHQDRVSWERSSSRSVLWLLISILCRPTGSHEGQQVGQCRHLHVLLPLRPLSASWQYTKDRIGYSRRRNHRDFLLHVG